MAPGHGLARLGRRGALQDQTRPGRQLGRAARPDVGVEPAPRQAMDRRPGAGRACAELSAARAGGALGVAAARAARLLPRSEHRRRHGQSPRTAVWPHPGLRRRRNQARRRDAAFRHPGARFQLGHRRSDRDPLPRGDGRGGDQDRGAGPRRSRPHQRTAHRARPGQEGHRPRPQEARGGGHRPRPCRPDPTSYSRISRPA